MPRRLGSIKRIAGQEYIGRSAALEGRPVIQHIQRGHGLALSTALRSSLLVHTTVIKTSPVLQKHLGVAERNRFMICIRCELKRNYSLQKFDYLAD